ncbi:hypothetical protein [Desulfuromonas sp. AOP6]|uniref:hypothetical protein n=1 Tax=Desulfuromonas sp. AOP6 TaxID=1566351 RepID=UPI001284EA4B|nr:hypothetical protein [Desulfuromonas sp. AOP6]BCA79275.1 hypothetical protein AOP6_1062 [Desulfuromonas sp. AOP6]
MTRFYFALFLAAALANFGCTILILRELTRAEIVISYFDLRTQILKHLKTYKKLTLERLGRVGTAYYGYILTLGFLIIFGILSLSSALSP